jgi:hypothetical protein
MKVCSSHESSKQDVCLGCSATINKESMNTQGLKAIFKMKPKLCKIQKLPKTGGTNGQGQRGHAPDLPCATMFTVQTIVQRLHVLNAGQHCWKCRVQALDVDSNQFVSQQRCKYAQ